MAMTNTVLTSCAPAFTNPKEINRANKASIRTRRFCSIHCLLARLAAWAGSACQVDSGDADEHRAALLVIAAPFLKSVKGLLLFDESPRRVIFAGMTRSITRCSNPA